MAFGIKNENEFKLPQANHLARKLRLVLVLHFFSSPPSNSPLKPHINLTHMTTL